MIILPESSSKTIKKTVNKTISKEFQLKTESAQKTERW